MSAPTLAGDPRRSALRPDRGPLRRTGGMARAKRREAIALVMPSLLPILVLSVAPLVMGVALAFTDARLVRQPDYQFVGVDNFVRLADNSFFWDSFRIGMIWAVSVTLLQLVAAMASRSCSTRGSGSRA